MNIHKNQKDLAERIFQFAVNVLKYLKTIANTEVARIIKKQLARSSTSSGANYEESQSSVSRVDFRNKVFIALKEMRESNYWLRICKSMHFGDINLVEELINESVELKKILGSIVSKLKKV